MSETDRLESELKVSKLQDELEAAREAMHADRTNEEAMARYNEASIAVAEARSAHREQFKVIVEEGDAAPQVDTIQVTAKVEEVRE